MTPIKRLGAIFNPLLHLGEHSTSSLLVSAGLTVALSLVLYAVALSGASMHPQTVTILLLLCVLYAALRSGILAALVSATLTFVFATWLFFVFTDDPAQAGETARHSIVLLGALFYIPALLVGLYKERADVRILVMREQERTLALHLRDVSHELKTPIATLSLYVQILENDLQKKGGDPKEHLEHLTAIVGELDKLNTLAVSLVDTSTQKH